MNIYALKGFLVRVRKNRDSLRINEHLKEGKVYTVECTEVHSWHTDVYLQEVPNIDFNPVDFDDVLRQSKKDDKKHPDWAKYNK